MKKYSIIFALLFLVGCAGLPSFDVTTPDGKNFAITKNKVAYEEGGKQITCLKEADLWGCSYLGADGLAVVINDIDVAFLEQKVEAVK